MEGEALAAACGLLDAPGLGPGALRVLLGAAGGGEDFLRLVAAVEPPGAVRAAAGRDRAAQGLCEAWSLARSAALSDRARRSARRSLDTGARAVSLLDAGYPALLREIPSPPPLLFLRGPLDPGDAPVVAVVGTRRASAYGRAMAQRIAGDLAASGVVVASGLARGIDAEAHRAALAAARPTLAVLGTGIDVCYPPEHRELANEIAATGLLVTELPACALPLRFNFPARNRILAGLSRAVVVVEARARSGALITARAGGDQNRDVCAVPGDATAPGSAGPHRLLKEGAALVESGADVFEACPALVTALGRPVASAAPPSEDEARPLPSALLPHIGLRPRTLDELVDATGWPASNLGAVLEELVLLEVLAREPGGGYVLARRAARRR